MLGKTEILQINTTLSDLAMQLVNDYALSHGMKKGDALIAVIALEHGATALTSSVPTSMLFEFQNNKSELSVSYATLLLFTQILVCCIDRLNPHRISDRRILGQRRTSYYSSLINKNESTQHPFQIECE